MSFMDPFRSTLEEFRQWLKAHMSWSFISGTIKTKLFWLSLCALTALSTSIVTFLTLTHHHHNEMALDNTIEDLEWHLHSVSSNYTNLLLSTQNFLYSNPSPSPQEWKEHTDPLVKKFNSLPGIVSISLIRVLKPVQINAFVMKMREHYGGSFQIIPHGVRPFYCILSDVSFATTHYDAPLGYDLCANNGELPAFHSNGHIIEALASPPKTLQIDQGSDRGLSTVLQLPIYASAAREFQKTDFLVAWISVPIRLNAFFSKLEERFQGLQFKATQVDSDGNTYTLFDNASSDQFYRQISIPFASSRWVLNIINTLPSPFSAASYWFKISLALLLSFYFALVLCNHYARHEKISKDAKKFNLKAQEYQDRIRRIAATTPGAFYERDHASHSIQFVGDYIQDIIGFGPSEISCCEEFQARIHPEDVDGLRHSIRTSALNNEPYHVEYRFKHKNGSWVWIYDSGKIYSEDEDQSTQSDFSKCKSLGIMFSHTENKANRDKIAQLYNALHNASEGIIELEKNNHISSVNDAFAKMVGQDKSTLTFKHIKDFICDGDASLFEYILESCYKTGKSSTELHLKTSDDAPLDIYVTAVPKYGQSLEKEGCYLFIYDISERKYYEKSLLQARQEAIEANHTKTEFLSIMGHELRTPLNAIMGYSDILLEEGKSSKELEAIKTASSHLLDVINDIISVSHLETGRDQAVSYTFSVRDLMQGVYREMLPLAEINDNTLELSIPERDEFIHSDSTKIKQSLMLLLRNALNTTENQTTSLTAYVEPNGRICFSVTDKSAPIPQAKIKQILQPFGTSNIQENRQHDKTGVQLAIIKRYTELLRGEFIIKSSDQGNSFILRLPRGNIDASLKQQSA